MIIPMRCYSCNKPISHLWEKYQKLLTEGKTNIDALHIIGLNRYCCARMFLTHVDINQEDINQEIKPL